MPSTSILAQIAQNHFKVVIAIVTVTHDGSSVAKSDDIVLKREDRDVSSAIKSRSWRVRSGSMLIPVRMFACTFLVLAISADNQLGDSETTAWTWESIFSWFLGVAGVAKYIPSELRFDTRLVA